MTVRVLVIDDDPDIQRLERRILQREGYEVVTAADDAQALAGIVKEPPDLIVADLNLLGRHGRDLRERLRAAGEARPALLVSSSADDGPPGVPYLRRPFARTELVRAVEQALATARP
ncbi:MAG TPA: response regulator [Thermomicrobiales bacterium]|nr:response regulator [Thermomicrobiales bacterium]